MPDAARTAYVSLPNPPAATAEIAPLEVRLHWLTATFPAGMLTHVGRLLAQVFEDDGNNDLPAMAGYRYSERVDHGEGVHLLWSEDDNGDYTRPDACVMLRGSALDRLTGLATRELLVGLADATDAGDGTGPQIKATRVDAAADDFERVRTPNQIWRECVENEAGEPLGLWSGARWYDYHASSSGPTLYLGKPGRDGSGCNLCIYDKNAESGGAIKAIRWECRYWHDQAVEAFVHVLHHAHVNTLAVGLAELVGGRWDFWVSKEKNAQRRTRPHWWEVLRGRLGTARFRPPVLGRN